MTETRIGRSKRDGRPSATEDPRVVYTIEFSTYDAGEAGEIFRLIEAYTAKHNFSGVLGQSREAEDGGEGFADLGVLP